MIRLSRINLPKGNRQNCFFQQNLATNWPTPDEVVPEIVVAKIAAVVVIVAAVAYLWVKVTPPG